MRLALNRWQQLDWLVDSEVKTGNSIDYKLVNNCFVAGIEKQIASSIAISNGLSITKLGLHFDKVVTRLFGNLRSSIEQEISSGKIVLLTLTAPIKVPAKTEIELKRQIKDFLESEIRHQDRIVTIYQNRVRLRIIDCSLKRSTRFIGFVHNPSSDSKQLLDLAMQWINEKNGMQ